MYCLFLFCPWNTFACYFLAYIVLLKPAAAANLAKEAATEVPAAGKEEEPEAKRQATEAGLEVLIGAIQVSTPSILVQERRFTG